MPSQRCRVFYLFTKEATLAKCAKHFHCDASGTLRAEHPKAKPLCNSLAESYDKALAHSSSISQTRYNHSLQRRHRRRGECHIRNRLQANFLQPNSLTPWPSTTFIQLMGATRLNNGQLPILCTPQWLYQEGNLHCDRFSRPRNT